MSVKNKVLAGAAALAMTGGGLGISAAVANAATPSCGTSCVTYYTQGWGSGSVLDVYKASAAIGQKITLWSASNTDKAEDFTVADQGTVKQFYKAGLASAALKLHYKNDEAFEIEYTPYGVQSGLCVGSTNTAASGTAVTLRYCGVTAKTLWVEDSSLTSGGYTALINGSGSNFSDPLVLSNRGGTLVTNNVHKYSDGTIYDNQLWAKEKGVL